MNSFLSKRLAFGGVAGVGLATAVAVTQGQRPAAFLGSIAIGLVLGLVGGYWCAMMASLGAKDPIAPYAKPAETKRKTRGAKKGQDCFLGPS
jgi:phosphate/sulfate permease